MRKIAGITGIILILLGLIIPFAITPIRKASYSLVVFGYIIIPLGFIFLIISISNWKNSLLATIGIIAIVVGLIIFLLNQNTSLESSRAMLPIFFILYVIPSGIILIIIAIIKAIVSRHKNH